MEPYKDYPFEEEGWDLIPEYMREGVYHYVMDGIRPGDFLCSLFRGASLTEIVARADNTNQRYLLKWAQFMYMYMPAESQGTLEKFNSWIKMGGLRHETHEPK